MSGFLIILAIQNFLGTILIFIVIYYLIKIIGKIALTSIVNQARTNAQQGQQQANRKREGEVTIVSNKNKSSKYERNEGEYVDFEEID